MIIRIKLISHPYTIDIKKDKAIASSAPPPGKKYQPNNIIIKHNNKPKIAIYKSSVRRLLTYGASI